MAQPTRRLFLAGAAVAGVLTPVHVVSARSSRPRMAGDPPASFPSQDPALVREIVGKSHVDVDAVRALVTAHPELAKSSWDWGFGDWESALGAASHMGRRDIADVLIAHGARPDLFTFAMLGAVDVVRSACEAQPGVQRVPGPHGITLLQHARRGGDEAADVVEYLESLGDADERPTNLDLDANLAAAYVGVYASAAVPGRYHVTFSERRSILSLRRDEMVGRFLMHQGGHVFRPSGAPSVRIVFDVRDGQATTFSIHDGPVRVDATRVPE